MANKRKKKVAPTRMLRTVQVDTKHKELSVTSDHAKGMYLEVVIKDNKDGGEVITALHSPADVRLVETAVTRLVRHYLRSYPLVPPQGFYSLLVMPRWVPVTTEVDRG